MIRGLSLALLIAIAAAAAEHGWSFWWVTLASAFAGATSVASGPAFYVVVAANKQGRLDIFPRILFLHTVPHLVAAFALWYIVRSSREDTLKVACVWIAAYVVAGILYVRRDLKQPLYNQPGYVHTFSGRLRMALTWPFMSLLVMFSFGRFNWKYARQEALPTYATFFGICAGSTWLMMA